MTNNQQKLEQLRSLLATNKLDGILLQRASSFAWATGGADSVVNRAATNGVAALWVTNTDQFLVADNIEMPRLEKEEKLIEQGWRPFSFPWHQAQAGMERLARGQKLGADGQYPGALDLSSELARLRSRLTPQEGERFRDLAQRCAQAMRQAIHLIRPGQTEFEIQALLAQESEQRGVQAIVNLIATDERVFDFRHPLPTGKKLDRYAMLVLCGRRYGLVCSLTRLVHFGQLPTSLKGKAEAVARVDATFIQATRPGATLGEIFAQAQEAYRHAGYADEWQLHHQGGPAGYEPREFLAYPGSMDKVIAGQVYAWNPSITGTKSEDTILVGQTENEVLTQIEGWPKIQVQIGEAVIDRPGILEIV